MLQPQQQHQQHHQQQALKGSSRKFSKSFIRWSKNGNSLNSFQGIDKSEVRNNFNQSGECTGSNCNIYNISNCCCSGINCRSFCFCFLAIVVTSARGSLSKHGCGGQDSENGEGKHLFNLSFYVGFGWLRIFLSNESPC